MKSRGEPMVMTVMTHSSSPSRFSVARPSHKKVRSHQVEVLYVGAAEPAHPCPRVVAKLSLAALHLESGSICGIAGPAYTQVGRGARRGYCDSRPSMYLAPFVPLLLNDGERRPPVYTGPGGKRWLLPRWPSPPSVMISPDWARCARHGSIGIWFADELWARFPGAFPEFEDYPDHSRSFGHTLHEENDARPVLLLSNSSPHLLAIEAGQDSCASSTGARVFLESSSTVEMLKDI